MSSPKCYLLPVCGGSCRLTAAWRASRAPGPPPAPPPAHLPVSAHSSSWFEPGHPPACLLTVAHSSFDWPPAPPPTTTRFGARRPTYPRKSLTRLLGLSRATPQPANSPSLAHSSFWFWVLVLRVSQSWDRRGSGATSSKAWLSRRANPSSGWSGRHHKALGLTELGPAR